MCVARRLSGAIDKCAQKTKNKWKATLREGVVRARGRDYVFLNGVANLHRW